MEWEVKCIEWMQNNLGIFGTVFGKFFAFLGGEIGLLIMILIVAFCWKKEVGLRLALMIASINAWLPMIKCVVLRPRPYMAHPERIEALAPVDNGASQQDVIAQGYSFPSMHAASAAAFYTFLAQERKRKWAWIVSICVTLLIGVSRVTVGMHYPTDVLAGWALGLVGIALFHWLYKMINKQWIRQAIFLTTVLPGIFFVRTQDYFTALGLLIGAVFAIPFEEKYVRFHDTRNGWAMVLRTAGAFGIYLALNTLMKLPFNAAFLSSDHIGAFLIRTVRYAVIVFVIFAVYPKVFPLFERVGKRKSATDSPLC